MKTPSRTEANAAIAALAVEVLGARRAKRGSRAKIHDLEARIDEQHDQLSELARKTRELERKNEMLVVLCAEAHVPDEMIRAVQTGMITVIGSLPHEKV